MHPPASSSQCSSIATPLSSSRRFLLRSPAGVATNFSSGCSVSVGNEVLADGVSLSGTASIALGELKCGSPSFLVRDFSTRPASVRQRGWSHVLRFLPFLAQQLLQYFDAFVHMFFLQQERRQEAQDRVLGRVEEHTLGQSLLYQWTRGDVEHQALNEPAAARFAGRGVLRDEFLELLMQVAANLRDVFEQVLFFYDCQIFEPDAAGQRTTAEGSALLSGRNRGGEGFF